MEEKQYFIRRGINCGSVYFGIMGRFFDMRLDMGHKNYVLSAVQANGFLFFMFLLEWHLTASAMSMSTINVKSLLKYINPTSRLKQVRIYPTLSIGTDTKRNVLQRLVTEGK